MWTKGEEGALAAFPPPGIAAEDLTGFALELALWGGGEGLAFLSPPPVAALAEARALLTGLGALGEDGRITGHGRTLALLPVHPRLAHMLSLAGPAAAPLAALLEERDPLPGSGADLTPRLRAIADPRTAPPEARPALDRIRAEAARLARLVPERDSGLDPSAMAALAYPDRIAMRRAGEAPRFLLSGGKGAVLDPADALARAPFLVATDLDGDPTEARIRGALAISEADLRRLLADRIRRLDTVEWSRREGRVTARREERLGALVLSSAPLPDPDPDAVARAAFGGLLALGLPWTPAARRLGARIALLRAEGMELPDCCDAALLADPACLLPWLGGLRTEAQLRALDLTDALAARLGPALMQEVGRLAPAYFETPLGRRVPVYYEGDAPSLSLRLQELFGVTRHPTVGPHRLPLRLTLLSPANRPIAVTTDLPGFWRGGYADVRKDMRGQYPKHPWPEDPTAEAPTLRAKPRR
jgi:ATP-dependent helicase HrpB